MTNRSCSQFDLPTPKINKMTWLNYTKYNLDPDSIRMKLEMDNDGIIASLTDRVHTHTDPMSFYMKLHP